MGQAGAVVGKSQSSVVSAGPRHAVGKCSLELQFLCLDGNSSPLTPPAGGDSAHQPRNPLPCGMDSLGAQNRSIRHQPGCFPCLDVMEQ